MKAKHTIFYDGDCGFCHRGVRAIALADHDGIFEFAPRGGETYRARMKGRRLPQHLASILVLTPSGRIFSRSRATLLILEKLGGFRRVAGRAMGLIPTFVLDLGYRFVAVVRHHLFRRPDSACPVVPPHLRKRFLP
ncbi:DUF393 domain-containing protein [Candidatus Sumerlaeota bacterium]|nr:DUF393 domain-containing protein [Candidatus Sumerlaeota bacterium]